MSEPSDSPAATLEQLAQSLQDSHPSACAPAPVIAVKTNTACAHPAAGVPAPACVRYTPDAMVQLMVDHPDWSHTHLAAHFGRQPSWVSAVLASDSFQSALDSRRHEVADPLLSATLEERFKGLAIRAATVLQEKLNTANVADLVVLKAAELGIKALGMGAKAPDSGAPALPSPQNSSETVAERLLAAMDARDRERQAARTVDVEAVEVQVNAATAASAGGARGERGAN